MILKVQPSTVSEKAEEKRYDFKTAAYSLQWQSLIQSAGGADYFEYLADSLLRHKNDLVINYRERCLQERI